MANWVCMAKQRGQWSIRSSHQRCSMKKGVLRNFTKFTVKHLCQSLFSNKVADLRPATLVKKKLWHTCFSVNFVKFLRTPFTEHLRWLLFTHTLHTVQLQFVKNHLTHFSPVSHFYIPWKLRKNLWFSDLFRGYRNVTPD